MEPERDIAVVVLDGAEPVSGATSSAVRRAFSRIFHKPLFGEVVVPAYDLGVCIGFALMSLAILLVTASGGSAVRSGQYPVLAALAAMCVFGESLIVRYSDSLSLTTSEIFYAIAIVALPAKEAALVIMCSVGLRSLIEPSWQELFAGISFTGFACALALTTVTAVTPITGVPRSFADVLVVALVFATIRFAECTIFLTIDAIQVRVAHLQYGRMRAIFGRSAYGIAQSLMPMIAQLPMAVLGVVAYRTSAWLVLLVFVPNFVGWHSARQAARLADAEHRVGIDPLTGLINRARLFDRAEEEIAVARRYGHDLSLVMGDLDNFKRVNDTLGHLVGDEVLRRTALALKTVFNAELFPLGRYGGEEFVILIPAVPEGGVLDLAERVRGEVEVALAEYGTSISLGVAHLEDRDRIESLIDRADKALYSAKYAGKNQVHEWPGGADRPHAVAA